MEDLADLHASPWASRAGADARAEAFRTAAEQTARETFDAAQATFQSTESAADQTRSEAVTDAVGDYMTTSSESAVDYATDRASDIQDAADAGAGNQTPPSVETPPEAPEDVTGAFGDGKVTPGGFTLPELLDPSEKTVEELIAEAHAGLHPVAVPQPRPILQTTSCISAPWGPIDPGFDEGEELAEKIREASKGWALTTDLALSERGYVHDAWFAGAVAHFVRLGGEFVAGIVDLHGTIEGAVDDVRTTIDYGREFGPRVAAARQIGLLQWSEAAYGTDIVTFEAVDPWQKTSEGCARFGSTTGTVAGTCKVLRVSPAPKPKITAAGNADDEYLAPPRRTSDRPLTPEDVGLELSDHIRIVQVPDEHILAAPSARAQWFSRRFAADDFASWDEFLNAQGKVVVLIKESEFYNHSAFFRVLVHEMHEIDPTVA